MPALTSMADRPSSSSSYPRHAKAAGFASTMRPPTSISSKESITPIEKTAETRFALPDAVSNTGSTAIVLPLPHATGSFPHLLPFLSSPPDTCPPSTKGRIARRSPAPRLASTPAAPLSARVNSPLQPHPGLFSPAPQVLSKSDGLHEEPLDA